MAKIGYIEGSTNYFRFAGKSWFFLVQPSSSASQCARPPPRPLHARRACACGEPTGSRWLQAVRAAGCTRTRERENQLRASSINGSQHHQRAAGYLTRQHAWHSFGNSCAPLQPSRAAPLTSAGLGCCALEQQEFLRPMMLPVLWPYGSASLACASDDTLLCGLENSNKNVGSSFDFQTEK